MTAGADRPRESHNGLEMSTCKIIPTLRRRCIALWWSLLGNHFCETGYMVGMDEESRMGNVAIHVDIVVLIEGVNPLGIWGI
jgi:hypothetical protein